jgi:KaiC/GvpD/RAD55 family RecA-like ATPase
MSLFELHEKFPDKDISLDEVIAFFWVKYPSADKVVYEAIFKSLSELKISDDVGRTILSEIKSRSASLKLSEKAYKVAQGVDSVLSLQEFIDENFGKDDHHLAIETIPDVNDIFLELMSNANTKQGLRWRLNCLNKSLGSLRQGDFGFIFARPETGKTTFLASEVTSFLSATGRPIIWFNNEEQGYKVMCRVLQAYFGITSDVLLSNLKKYYARFNEETSNRFKLFDAATISKHEVQRLIDKHDPALVLYDQITKIKGFKADRNDLMLGDICQWARELAKGSHAAIGVSQADGTAEGVRYLTMEHVANAKTAMQAEADFILGIGKVHDQNQEYVRFLNISKNKLFGDQDSIADLRHGRFETMIEPQIARYKDIIKFD